MKIAPVIELSSSDKLQLESWTRSRSIEKRLHDRACIVLLSYKGLPSKEIARQMSIREATVSKWRNRYVKGGIAGLHDAFRSGKPLQYTEKDEKKILASLDQKPPKGYSVWNGDLLANKLGVSKEYVWRTLKKYNIHLQRNHSWCISTDPEFAEKSADIIGLYLAPPENAIILSIDEKPAIQALERAQGWLRLPSGKAITGYNHEYKRHGTTTLFAALNIVTGLIKTAQYNRRRRKEFLQFLNQVIKEYEGQQIHVILDNLSTHKPKNDKWLQRHKNVTFHYTPTHASWLNQVEIWFSILTRQALKNTSFTSKKDLVQAIEDYVEAYNKDAAPFEWTKTTVYPIKPTEKINYANL